jgi:gephyrin
MSKKLTAAILIISDSASTDPSTDKSGPTLEEIFAAADWEVIETEIVSDDVIQIQRFVQRWADGEDAVSAIVTSGGTGFAVRDVTPEAVNPLIHRQAPGLVYVCFRCSCTREWLY